MSGIFRDSFQNVVELLDDAFQRAAAADEPDELNFIAKHARKLKQEVGGAFRLFSMTACERIVACSGAIPVISW